ncbi:TIGR02444 family protein [Marinobacter sp. C2H3]|uniref:TIGR02444 family protein n=1 Tax=Marinobacter sp. C2H3 TaxID=3119003 RepID=UPI00300ED1BF
MELPKDLEPETPLWRYALSIWRQPDVREACLALQGEGWSVTRIVCAGWHATRHQPYTGDEPATVTEWRARVTGPLRAIRQALPKQASACQTLREGVASAELAAEQVELALAWHAFMNTTQAEADMPGSETLIHSNLAAAAPDAQAANTSQALLRQLANALAPTTASGAASPCS